MKRFLFAISCLTLLAVLALAVQAERLVLVAKKNLQVVAGLSPQERAAVIANLAPGERVAVIACEDIKTDVYPKVRLTSGAEGYILSSGFELVRARAGLDGYPVVFSCRGYFSRAQE